jgi:hypothetical protein
LRAWRVLITANSQKIVRKIVKKIKNRQKTKKRQKTAKKRQIDKKKALKNGKILPQA